MFLVGVPIFVTSFTIVYSWNLFGRGPMYQFDWTDPSKYLSPKVPDLSDKDFLGSDKGPTFSHLVVVEMYYDCQGRLLQQEVSKMKIQTGPFRVPGEEGLFTHTYKKSELLPTASGEEINEDNKIYDDQKDSAITTETPVIFQSQKKRIRTGMTIPETPSIKYVTVQPNVGAKKTFRPSMRDNTPKPQVDYIGPDRLIDAPIMSCPPGQNEDRTGKCRTSYP